MLNFSLRFPAFTSITFLPAEATEISLENFPYFPAAALPAETPFRKISASVSAPKRVPETVNTLFPVAATD